MPELNVNLFIRHIDSADSVCVGHGDPAAFLDSLGQHGWHIDGLTDSDDHVVRFTQWITDGFEVSVGQEIP